MTPVRSNNSKGPNGKGEKSTGHSTITGVKCSIINV